MRIALVGAGNIADRYAACIVAEPELELAGATDLDRARAEALVADRGGRLYPDLAAVLEFGPSHLARAGVSPEAWLGELEAAGFESFAVDEATGVCRPASAPALAGVFSVNVLLLRPGAASRHPDLAFA